MDIQQKSPPVKVDQTLEFITEHSVVFPVKSLTGRSGRRPFFLSVQVTVFAVNLAGQ